MVWYDRRLWRMAGRRSVQIHLRIRTALLGRHGGQAHAPSCGKTYAKVLFRGVVCWVLVSSLDEEFDGGFAVVGFKLGDAEVHE